MTTEMRVPYIIRITDYGFDCRLDFGSMDGADNSKMFAKLLGYPVLYNGVIYDSDEYDSVMDAVKYANESRRNGRFNPKVLEEILPNLKSKPGVNVV